MDSTIYPQVNPDEKEVIVAQIGIDENNDLSHGEIFDTTSLRSSITAYRQEHGRRYHAYKDGEYWHVAAFVYFPPETKYGVGAPTTINKMSSLIFHRYLLQSWGTLLTIVSHHLHTVLLDGKLFLAPIGKDIQKVLDLGTGTGIWAIDFADEFPSAVVTGTDLSPIQPSWVPPNVKFEIEDFNDEWTFRRNDFDYIHLKCLLGCVADWPKFYQQAYSHLKAGAWMEHLEISIVFRSDDDSVKPDSALALYSNVFLEAGQKHGKSLSIAEDMKVFIESAGFVNVVEKVYRAPIRGWPSDPKLKELGHWGLLELDVGVEGFALALLTRVMGWKYTEVQAFLGKIRGELRNRNIHSYHNIHVVYAQKPMADTNP